MLKHNTDLEIWQAIQKDIDAARYGIDEARWQQFCERIEAYLTAQAEEATKRVIIHIDGAARGNPGPAGIGIVLSDITGKTLGEYYEFIGQATNNVAEYHALLKALDLAKEHHFKTIEVRTDCELLAHQFDGTFRVSHPRLVELFLQAQEKRKAFDQVKIEQIAREDNRRADRLANLAIDAAMINKE